MAFNSLLPASSLNGLESSDDIAVSLDRLSKGDLEKLLKDIDEIKRLAKNSTEACVKKSIALKETSMQENRRLAEANLALEPQFLAKRQDLAETYDRLAEAKSEYQRLKAQIDASGTNYSPTTILAVLQAAHAQLEEKSEKLADDFISKTVGVDEFLREFLPLRKLCNERRLKAEKLAEKLSRGQPVTSSRPTLPPPTYRDVGRMSTPADNPRPLYPDFAKDHSSLRNPDYGFKS
ncbi:Williams-beuren syndrome critical region protein [Paragonimus heterotremus]|uniref:Williams-beuren syndrome critical region protein n=1 Tax=Paragonimus heterotremus TaxID=100268 RepID=A0A8J4TC04_9TREM|nr:Williams-beuren syndrome critical region protein [Paragonimus heterotremus]